MQPVQQHTGQGQQAPQEPIRRRISSFLARTVSRFRIALLVVLIAAAAFLVGYTIYNEINKQRMNVSTVMVEAAQDLYDKWSSESDATKKAALEKDLLSQLDTVVARYPRQYGAQRGLFLRAGVSYGKKAWDAALKDYQTLAARFPSSYLAPIGLFNAAICFEEKGDAASAEKLYTEIYQKHKDSTVGPRAMFDAARISEASGDFAGAQKTYEAMDTTYSQSVWTKLAKDRVIELKVAGKVK
jgi:TolA-binding protein